MCTTQGALSSPANSNSELWRVLKEHTWRWLPVRKGEGAAKGPPGYLVELKRTPGHPLWQPCPSHVRDWFQCPQMNSCQHSHAVGRKSAFNYTKWEPR